MSFAKKKLVYLLVLGIVVIAIIENYIGFSKYSTGAWFWDLNVYQLAVNRYTSGFDPYETKSDLLFLYHPIVLHFFSLFDGKLKFVLQVGYFILCAKAIIEIINQKKYILPFLIGFSFLGLGVLSIATGNVTFFLHLILISLLIGSLSSKRNVLPFVCVVALCSLIKPYMIAYELIPVLVAFRRGDDLQALIKTLLIIVVTLSLIVLAHSMFFYDLFLGFYEALKTQTLVRGDVGLSLASYLILIQVSGGLALGLHLLLIAMIGSVIIGYFFFADKDNEAAFIMALYFILTALNPRLKEYDVPILMFTLFAASIFVANSLSDWIFLLVANIFPLLNGIVTEGFLLKNEHVIFLSVTTIFLFFIKKYYEIRRGSP
jgi:hypothetical protein